MLPQQEENNSRSMEMGNHFIDIKMEMLMHVDGRNNPVSLI
jgi:hypothetical protein